MDAGQIRYQQPVSDNNLVPSTGNTNGGARLDVSAWSFWITGQKAFFDVRVFDPNASRYQSKSLKQCFVVNEREKKLLYNRRSLEKAHASFTPLIFTIMVQWIWNAELSFQILLKFWQLKEIYQNQPGHHG